MTFYYLQRLLRIWLGNHLQKLLRVILWRFLVDIHSLSLLGSFWLEQDLQQRETIMKNWTLQLQLTRATFLAEDNKIRSQERNRLQ